MAAGGGGVRKHRCDFVLHLWAVLLSAPFHLPAEGRLLLTREGDCVHRGNVDQDPGVSLLKVS